MDQLNTLKNEKGEISTENIKKIIPYDEPFLFIDSVLSLSSNRIVAVKNLTGKEEFFKGHFVGFPIMPGALTVEGMGQASTLLARSNILNTLSGQKAKKITLEEIGGLNLKGKNVFVIPVSDNIYLNKVQEKFPEGELMWYVSPYSKKILFNIYSINKD